MTHTTHSGYFCDKFNPFLTGLIGCFLTSLGLLAMVPPPFLQPLILVNKPQLITATIVTGDFMIKNF